MKPIAELMTGREVDVFLRYPRGRSLRLARKGLIPHVLLPDGEIRFDENVLQQWLGTRIKTCSVERKL